MNSLTDQQHPVRIPNILAAPFFTLSPTQTQMKMLTTMTYRMPNFTLEQKLYLLQKIHSVVDAVQDFRKDTNTTVYRNAVWAELAQAFNEAFPNRPPSSVGSLKTLWKRLKVECRVALQRRQEQQAAGMPLTALTQVQREVMALVPNLISNIEDMDGDGSCALITNSSPGAVTAGSNGNEQEDLDQNNEIDSKELVAIDLGLVSPPEATQNSGTPPGSASSPPSHIFFSHSSTSRGAQQRSSVLHPSQSRAGSGSGSRSASTDPPRRVSAVPQVTPSASSENSFVYRDSQGQDSGWEARRQEALELEHQQTMSLLLLQQCVWEEKRRAAQQKEKAARAKKRYYQAKLHKLGVEIQLSSSDSDDGGEPTQT
ncbi:Fibrinogen silencer-binding protein [Bagarius yarrelli]|uniref:Fibrinogen silencer-binding protein n=1 Tax=Bagarius yarrelli TaxID=175774 RepID=A0A556UFI2_BAGYA|nr:Fibrinogen silencer-binding protein [Bagarius yarrelli]